MPPTDQSVLPEALLTWQDLSSRAREQPDVTLSYGSDLLQKVDVWVPQGPGPFATVLMVHGGCWQSGVADRSLMDWAAADLRRSGYAVWNIDYRGVDRPGGGYPGTFLDAAAAADLLNCEAPRLRLNVRKIVAIGHSAGGHLALWLAARAKLPKTSLLAVTEPLRINHVIALGSLPDLEATAASPDNGCGTDVVARLVGPVTATHPDPFADTSMTRLLPIGVVQDLVNGDEDRIIPARFPRDYAAEARAAGDSVNLHRVAGAGHVELIAPGTSAWARTCDLLAKAFSLPANCA